MTSQTGRHNRCMVRAGCLVGAAALVTAAAGAVAGPAAATAMAGPAGATWTQSKPQIPQAHSGSLTAESCPGTSTCVAVGYATGPAGPSRTLAEAWNGTAWRVLATPNPPGSKGSDLNAVSCPAATACSAVGTYVDSSGTRRPLAESWNGSTWTIRATPDQPGSHGTVLDGVSCPAASACVAVGYYEDVISQDYPQAFAEAWNGQAWRILPAPDTAGIESPLYAVSCTSPGACIAVGAATSSTGVNGPLAEAWNGTAWAILPAIAPSGSDQVVLNGISCSGGDACTAVGYYFPPHSFGKHTLAEAWNGSSWTVQPTPNPDGYASLAAVSCISASDCTAVGSKVLTAPTVLAEAWNGSAWAAQTAPGPAGASAFTAVSCAAAGACGAAGYSGPLTGARHALAEARTGTTWTLQAAVSPLGALASSLGGVSCTAAGSCTAVGDYHAVRSSDLELAEAWNGSAWSIEPTPGTNETRILNAVSCTAPDACAAVGYRGASQLAETWNGTAWTAQTPPSPQNGVDPVLSGVSCTAASDCTAVGFYSLVTTGFEVTLAEVWNGTAWHVQQAVGPANTEIVGLSGVSCMPGGACTAVGSAGPSDPAFGAFVPLAEQRN